MTKTNPQPLLVTEMSKSRDVASEDQTFATHASTSHCSKRDTEVDPDFSQQSNNPITLAIQHQVSRTLILKAKPKAHSYGETLVVRN